MARGYPNGHPRAALEAIKQANDETPSKDNTSPRHNEHSTNGYTTSKSIPVITNGTRESNNANNATTNPQPTPNPKKKQLFLNAFLMNTPSHLSPGLWRHPRSQSSNYNSLSFWTSLAQLLDRAGFHAIFLADVLGHYDVYKGPGNASPCLPSGAQFPVNDPLLLVPAMASVTKNLIFGVTASTSFEPPFGHARRFSTVDHLAGGRVAWNIVTSGLDSAAKNFGLEGGQIEHEERYAIAEEFMDVLYKLWESSWATASVPRNLQTGPFAHPELVRPINHQGPHFSVAGPHICEPSPQRTPFLFQAGSSPTGIAFGSKHAEAIFVTGQTPEKVRHNVQKIRSAALLAGRKPETIKIMVGVIIIVDATDELAQEKLENYISYGEREGALALFGGWTGVDLSSYSDDEDFSMSETPIIRSLVNGWSETVPGSDGKLPWTKKRIGDYLMVGGMQKKMVGSAKTVVDEMEKWVEMTGVDGFNLSHVVNPGSFEDIIEFVIPELRRRGLFRETAEKEGATAREVFLGQSRLLDDHYGSQFKWDG